MIKCLFSKGWSGVLKVMWLLGIKSQTSEPPRSHSQTIWVPTHSQQVTPLEVRVLPFSSDVVGIFYNPSWNYRICQLHHVDKKIKKILKMSEENLFYIKIFIKSFKWFLESLNWHFLQGKKISNQLYFSMSSQKHLLIIISIWK